MPDIKLTDAQRVILSAASARDSGLILPLPKSLTTNKASLAKVFLSLTSKGLISKRPAKPGEDAWEAAGARISFVITSAGLGAIGIEAQSASGSPDSAMPSEPAKSRMQQTTAKTKSPRPTNKSSKLSAEEPKPPTKLSLVIAALRSRKGATIDDLIETTSWQAHSIRGAISGALKKKLGLKVVSTAVDGRGRVYRIAE